MDIEEFVPLEKPHSVQDVKALGQHFPLDFRSGRRNVKLVVKKGSLEAKLRH